MTGAHDEHEDFPWTIAVVDHPPRTVTPGYVKSRALMHKLVDTTTDWVVGTEPFQDHHGGSVWVKDATGWMCFQIPLGIEWSAQFCADPAKVDRLRAYAERLVAAFPDTVPGYEAFGYAAASELLATSITTAKQVADWTDSIFNASLPLPAAAHTGTLPHGAGYHHYPKPIVDIDHFRRDDFVLFVTDDDGHPAVVVPVALHGSGDGRVRLLAVHPNSRYAERLISRVVAPAEQAFAPAPAAPTEGPDVLDADDELARQAFVHQT